MSQEIDGCIASNTTGTIFSAAGRVLANLTAASAAEAVETLESVTNADYLESAAMNLTGAATSPEYFPLYRLSFMWYAPLGFLVTVIVAQIVSRISKAIGGKDTHKIDENLLSPWFPHCFRSRDQLLEPVLMVFISIRSF